MPSPRNKTRKARKCRRVKSAKRPARSGSSYTVRYYDTKPTIQGGKYISPVFDNCKQIYEVIQDDIWASNKRIVVRRLDNHKVILNIPEPSRVEGNAFDDNSDTERSTAKSLVLNDSDGDFTYVGHQVFSFKLLEKIPNYMVNYYIHLTPSGVMKPYIEGKKYMYSLRDKVAVLKASLHIDPTKFVNEQLKEIDAKFKTAKQIPFPFEMIDAGMK